MNQTVAAHAGVLALALIGAYWTWTREPDPTEDGDGVVLLAAKPEELERVVWDGNLKDGKETDVEVLSRKDTVGPYWWVKVTETTTPKAPQPPDPEEGAAEDPTGNDVEPPAADPKVDVKEFKSGEAAEKLLESLAPFMARRELSLPAGSDMKAYGLDEPEARVVLQRAGKPEQVFAVGGEAFGTRDRYLRDEATGTVYLIDGEPFRPLQHGKTRLPDRTLVPVEADATASVVVTHGSQSVTLEHPEGADGKRTGWKFAGKDGENEVAATWMDKLFRIRANDYVPAEEVPAALEVQLTVAFTGTAGEASTLELLKGTDPKGAEAWYARSEHTRGLVSVHKVLANEAVEDIGTVFSAAE